MKYPIYNMDLYQGSDEVIPLVFYSVDSEGNKTNINLGSSSFIMTIKDEMSDDDKTVITSEDGNIVTGTISNNTFTKTSTNPNAIQITIPYSITETFTMPKLVYDIFKLTSTTREILLHGTITMHKSVSYE